MKFRVLNMIKVMRPYLSTMEANLYSFVEIKWRNLETMIKIIPRTICISKRKSITFTLFKNYESTDISSIWEGSSEFSSNKSVL